MPMRTILVATLMASAKHLARKMTGKMGGKTDGFECGRIRSNAKTKSTSNGTGKEAQTKACV
jgi:hypothetical protein